MKSRFVCLLAFLLVCYAVAATRHLSDCLMCFHRQLFSVESRFACGGGGTTMASADRFSSWASGLDFSPAGDAARADMLDAIESMFFDQSEDDQSLLSPQSSPFTPGVPPRTTRGAGWAVDNSVRKAFHALALSVMTDEQQQRHRANALAIHKLQRATAFSCSEGAESVWSTLLCQFVCSCSHSMDLLACLLAFWIAF